MRLLTSKTLLLLALAFSNYACQKNDSVEPNPIEQEAPKPKLLRVATSEGSSREFSYNLAGEISHIQGSNIYSLDDGMHSNAQAVYNTQGKLAHLLIDGTAVDSKIVYHYTQDQLSKTEVFVNNVLDSYHTFEYDTPGRLETWYSYFTTLNSDQPQLKYKYTFSYDLANNLQLRTQYEKVAGNPDWQLYQKIKYEAYDSSYCVKHLTTNLFTPGIKLHQNNPGKIIITNYPGGTENWATHLYEYNTKKYPVKEITTAANGNSFETIYTYAD